MALDQVLSGRFPPNGFFFLLMASLNDLHFACVFWKPTKRGTPVYMHAAVANTVAWLPFIQLPSRLG